MKWHLNIFKLRPPFLLLLPTPPPPPPQYQRGRLSGSLERHCISLLDAIAWVHSAPPVWRLEPASRCGQERLGPRLPENGLCRFCLTFVKPKCVQWTSTPKGDVLFSLPHRPTAWSMVAVAANSFSEEAQRKPRNITHTHQPDSKHWTSTSVKIGEKSKSKLLSSSPSV